MIKLLLLILTLLAASCVTADRLTASTAGSIVDYVSVSRSQVAYIPPASDFIVTRLIPNGNVLTAAKYLTHLTYQRGCSYDTDFRFGNQAFPDLDCIYNGTGFVGCFPTGNDGAADTFFSVGQKVFFASGVQFYVELVSGLRVDVGVPSEKIVIDVDYCEQWNDQTAVVHNVTRHLLNREYLAIIPYFHPEIVFSVNMEAFEYVGLPTVIAYFMLGSPEISDVFEILASELKHTISSGNLVLAPYNLTIRSLQMPNGTDIFWDVQVQQVLFDEHNLVKSWKIFVDGAAILSHFPLILNPDRNATCTTIQTWCTGVNQQFHNMSTCMDFMNSIPLLKGFYAQSVGKNDVGCRAFHVSLTMAPPAVNGISGADIHCVHTSPFNAAMGEMGAAGIMITPCIDETGPWNPYVPPPTNSARHVIRDVVTTNQTGYYYVCDDPVLCKYKRIKKSGNIHWHQVAFSNMHESMLPAVGQLLQGCLDDGNC